LHCHRPHHRAKEWRMMSEYCMLLVISYFLTKVLLWFVTDWWAHLTLMVCVFRQLGSRG
jgi:hypothetical protein